MCAVYGLHKVSRTHVLLSLSAVIHYLWIYAVISPAAQSFQKQNGNRYVGFSQQDSGLGGSYLQNQLRRSSVSPGSAQSSSLNTETAVSSGYSKGLSSSGYKQTVSQPAQGGYASVRFAQSSSVSKPNWQMSKSNQAKVPKKQSFSLSASIASGSSLSKYSQNRNDLTDISKKRTWPIQQGTPRDSKYLSSSSASVLSPRTSYSFTSASHQSAAQKFPSAAAETAYYGQRGNSPSVKSSSLFSAVAPASQRNPVRMQTSASARARRVSSHRSAKASTPSHLSSPQNGRIGNNPGQTEVGKPYRSKLFPGTGGNAQGSYSRSLPVSNKHSAPVGFQPRSLEKPTNQRLSYKPSYTSTEQIPSSPSSLQASWNSRTSTQGARNLPASGSGGAGTSGQRFAPTRTHSIPQRFGGFAIRRLRDPADQKEESGGKPQQTYMAPSQQTASYKPQVQSVHQASKWKRMRPRQGH